MEEKTNGKIKKETIMAAIIVPFWIGVVIVLLGVFGIQQGWPAFLSLLFFMESGGNPENLKRVFVGAVVGILVSYGVSLAIPFIAGAVGYLPAVLLVVCGCIFLIILLGDVLPLIFNNYSFAYFMIASIFSEQATVEWLLVLVFGGAFFCAGVLGTMQFIAKRSANAGIL